MSIIFARIRRAIWQQRGYLFEIRQPEYARVQHVRYTSSRPPASRAVNKTRLVPGGLRSAAANDRYSSQSVPQIAAIRLR